MICDPGIPAKSYVEIALMALDKTYLNHDLANFHSQLEKIVKFYITQI